MKKNYALTTLFLLSIISINAQTTFDWENAVDNGPTITQTVNGITATFTVGTGNPQIASIEGRSKTSGLIIAGGGNDATNATFTFSSGINLTSIVAAQGASLNNSAETFTFVPVGGSNSNVLKTIPAFGEGAIVDLNWQNVTGFSVTSSGPTVFYIFDTLISDYTLSNNDFNTSNPDLKLYPNPSTDFISISGIKTEKKYEIISYLGAKIIDGSLTNNEKINITSLSNGIYFLKFDNGNTLKFIKN